jgi:hypothetical protein
MRRYREPAPEPDARLDRYRRAAARVFDGDRLVGHLTTRVDIWWTTEGPWWRRRDVRPEERVEWFLDYERAEPLAHPDGWNDGIARDVKDLDQDEFYLQGRTLRVQWLEGPEAEKGLTARGW